MAQCVSEDTGEVPDHSVGCKVSLASEAMGE